MSAPVALSSLLAIAILCKLLLEPNVPEGRDPARLLGQPIEVWVSGPVEDFNGQTPAQMLGALGGVDIVRSCLEVLLG